MLVQLHWQYRSGTTDFKAQKEINGQNDLLGWVPEIEKEFPLPKDTQWVFVTQESPFFVGVEENAETKSTAE